MKLHLKIAAVLLVKLFETVSSTFLCQPADYSLDAASSVTCSYGTGDQVQRRGSPLHAAAYERDKNSVERLRMQTFPRDSNGGNPLHAMALRSTADDGEIIALLCKNNKQIAGEKDSDGRTPFLVAVNASSYDFAKALQENCHGVEPFASDKDGLSSFHHVNNVEFADYLLSLSTSHNEINAKSNKDGNTPLNIAVKWKKSKYLVNWFVNNDAIDKSAVNNDGQSAVHVAVEVDYLEAINIFVQMDFDFWLRDAFGRMPLMYAVELGRHAIFQAAKSTFKPNELLNLLPLHTAARNNQVEMAKALIDLGINVTAQNIYGQTAFHEAAEHHSADVMKELVLIDTSLLTETDKYGRTPLHLACRRCTTKKAIEGTFHLFLEQLTETKLQKIVDARDTFGDSPLDMAVQVDCPEVVTALLLKLGANCTFLNKDGKTPLHSAFTNGNRRAFEAMLSTNKCSYDQTDACGNKVPRFDGTQVVFCSNSMPEIENGKAACGSFLAGATREVTCNDGYILKNASSSTLRCGDDGRWHFSGYCTRKCDGVLPMVLNGLVSRRPSRDIGSSAKLTCNPGYELRGQGTIECTKLAEWQANGYCAEFGCNEVPLINHANFSTPTTNWSAVGSQIMFKCAKGYVLLGSDTLKCGKDGFWEVKGFCQGVCDEPPIIINGYYDYQPKQLSIDTPLSFTCNAGFMLRGSNRIKCLPNLTWEVAGHCESEECKNTTIPVKHAAISDSKKAFGHFSCNSGTALRGSNLMTCTKNGQWKAVGYCDEFCQEWQPLWNQRLIESATTKYKIGVGRREISCQHGDHVIGDKTAICNKDGEWQFSGSCSNGVFD